MPDAQGNIKGIAVPAKPWESNLPPIGDGRRPPGHVTMNACGHWTKRGNPIRHSVCRNLPLDQCHHAQRRDDVAVTR